MIPKSFLISIIAPGGGVIGGMAMVLIFRGPGLPIVRNKTKGTAKPEGKQTLKLGNGNLTSIVNKYRQSRHHVFT